ncbi:hypothetical protein L6452_08393 [Arctium lappa]|uniref:Uncharacterized protein n=1 Tax=Arctium lappa TaxID=4217 RepID=A0ACB9DHM7_ARCLA|nr:hypothetical protein L6452_08393 [Arctium lappa]
MLSPVLNKLYIYNCPKIVLLDEHHHHPLISLEINRCENLESIRSIQGLTYLESLEIILCPNLLGIPDLHSQCHSLSRLQINHCDKITFLPSGFDHLAVVNSLSLGDFSDKLHSFLSLHGIEKMKNHLHSLELNGLYHWESIPEEIKHLNVLNSLQICRFGMKELPLWLTNMSSIRDIGFYCCDELDTEAVLRGAPKQVDVISINGGEVFIRKSDG